MLLNVKKNGIIRITCPNIDILFDNIILNKNKNTYNNPWNFYGIDRNKLSKVDEFLWCCFGYYSKSYKIRDDDLIIDKKIYNKFLELEKISDKEFDNYLKEYGKYGLFEFLRKKSEKLYPIFKYQLTGFHINWWNEGKVINFLKEAGFQKIFISSKNNSKNNELNSKEFDYNLPDIYLFIEAIK